MKKTIMTLAALAMASVASAAWTDLENVGLTHVNSNVYTVDSFTFSFMIPEGVLTSGSSEFLAYVHANGVSNGNNTQISFVLTEADGSYTLKAGRSNTTDDLTDITWQNTSEFTNLAANTVYSLTTTSGNISTVTLTPAVTTSDNQYDNQIITGGSTATAKFNSTYTVPEPATATLSLLALAGLAARRRRK